MTPKDFAAAIVAMGGTVTRRLGEDEDLYVVTFDGRRWVFAADTTDGESARLTRALREVRDAARGHDTPARPDWEYRREQALLTEREDPSIDYAADDFDQWYENLPDRRFLNGED